jgi:hypothetical protein
MELVPTTTAASPVLATVASLVMDSVVPISTSATMKTLVTPMLDATTLLDLTCALVTLDTAEMASLVPTTTNVLMVTTHVTLPSLRVLIPMVATNARATLATAVTEQTATMSMSAPAILATLTLPAATAKAHLPAPATLDTLVMASLAKTIMNALKVATTTATQTPLALTLTVDLIAPVTPATLEAE